MRKRAIVTGATGFIGTALCTELLACGYAVVAVIRPGSSRRARLEALLEADGEARERLTLVELELSQLHVLGESQIQADLFFHLAWNGSAGQAREQFEQQSCNLPYTVSAIRAAKRCGCRTFIGAGSQAEYGRVQGKAREAETVPNPFLLYGAAKLSCYQMGRLVARQEEISFVWPRIYSVYGPGENPGTLVDYVLRTLKAGDVPQVTDGETLWDFTYIEDCAGMLRALGEAPDAAGVYNLSYGQPRRLKEFIREMRDIVAPQSAIQFGAKKSDPQRTAWLDPDVTRIREIGYRCRTPFAAGIRKTAR